MTMRFRSIAQAFASTATLWIGCLCWPQTAGAQETHVYSFEEINGKPIGTTGGIAHFGFWLKDPTDIGEILQKVTNAGGSIIDTGEFVPGSPYIFFRDPDGPSGG